MISRACWSGSERVGVVKERACIRTCLFAEVVLRARMHADGSRLLEWFRGCACAQRESFDVIGRMGFDHDFGVSRCVALTHRA